MLCLLLLFVTETDAAAWYWWPVDLPVLCQLQQVMASKGLCPHHMLHTQYQCQNTREQAYLCTGS